MKDYLLAVALFATIAITLAADEECIQRRLRGLSVHWPNPTDCSRFYRCSNKNSKRELICPRGKEYNPVTGRCTNKGRSPCRLSLMAPLKKAANNPCADKISGTFVPDTNSCQRFYICESSLAYPQTCNAGSYFNTNISACEPDTSKLCWENLCIKKPNGTFIAHGNDCHSFYICYEEKPIVQKCPGGSYFNTESHNCVPGECPSETTTTTCAPETTTSKYTSKSPTTTCAPETTTIRSTTTTCAPETPTTQSTTTTCATETSTTKSTTTSCTPEMTTRTCIAKTTTSSCSPVITTTICPEKTTTKACSTKTTSSTCILQTTTSTRRTTTNFDVECPNVKCNVSECQDAKNGFVFPAQNTTAGFCVCADRKPEYHKCDGNAIFHITLKICMDQEQIVCPSNKCSQLPDKATFTASNTTTGYCRCLDGTATFFECNRKGAVYNDTLQHCVKANKVYDYREQGERPTKLCRGLYREGDFVAHPQNCMLFFICYEGELVESSCEEGNYFEDQTKICLPDTVGKCPDSHSVQARNDGRRSKRSVRAKCVEGTKTPAADCDKYYKCSGGHQLLYGCGKDNFFNVTTLACQLDIKHVCWPVNSCTEGEKIPYPDDNTKFYQCKHGKLVLLSCDSNQYFNKPSKACVAKKECTCPGGYKEGDISAHPTDCDKFYICVNSEQVLHHCGKGNYFNKKTLSCEKDVKNTCNTEKPCSCPGGYEEGELSPHPNDCDKYYVCVGGKQVLQECGENNYFDKTTLSCKADVSNQCWTKEDCTCAGGYEEGDFSAHPKECSKYYICHDGQQVLQDCGINNHFNNDTLACEPDIYHVCWPNLCAGRPNGVLVANSLQCNGFFLCENENPIPRTCYEGQRFDPKSSACVADLKAICYNPCANETADSVALLPHPICNKYYFCNGRKTFVGTCQVGGFDSETGVCNKEKKCFPNPCYNSSVLVFPDPYDPRKFYWCDSEKQPIPYTCPPGKEFNLEYKMCKKFSDPDCPVCTKDGTFPTLYEGDSTEFCVCSEGSSTKIECPADYVFNAELGTCYSNAPCDPSFCLEAKEYDTAPNRNDSKSFCMCFNKKAVTINCPNNGTFNPYTLECSDYEISPECAQSTCVGVKNNTHIFKPTHHKSHNGYCQCINQIATFRPCNYGSTLNPDLLICQLAEINCNSYQCRHLPDKTIIPSVTTTEGYCECIAGVATYRNCPNNGEFNVTTKQCEAPLCDLTKCKTSGSSAIGPFAASIPNGFCMCDVGYVSCPTVDTLFSDTYKNCIDPCSQMFCNDKPDKYLVSSLINEHSFCVCHDKPTERPTYEKCTSKSFIFNETKQMCVPNIQELCGSDVCKSPGVFEAKGTLSGFCYCSSSGKAPTFEKCLKGVFVPVKSACLPTAKDVCDVSLCAGATIEHPVTLPSNNSAIEFCYCSSPSNAMLLPCPYGKHYNQAKAMCISAQEESCSCPNGVVDGAKVADPAACNKHFICVDGKLEPRTCPQSNYFNVDVNDCVPDTEGICARKSNCTCLGIYYENELLPHPVNPQMYYACQGNTLHEYKCQTGRIFSATQKQCVINPDLRQKRSINNSSYQPEVECLENEKRSVPSNCSQYEICLQQTWQRRTCSNYLYYNAEQRKCLKPRDDLVCSYAKVTELPTCNASMEHYLLSAKSCQQYYQCQDGKWLLKSCERHKYFNGKISTCLPFLQDPSFKCEELLGNSTTSTKETENYSCQHLSQRFYAKNCAMYLICLDNDWWYQHCPADMFYNRTLNYCVRDAHQQCGDVEKTALTSDTEEYSKDSCQQDGLLRASAIACNRYFVCLNGKWQVQHCAVGEFYDVVNTKCSSDTEGACKHFNTGCLENVTRSIPQNCSSFEKCSNDGKWLKMSCRLGEVFDELLNQCTINQGMCSTHGLKRACRQNETKPVYKNCSMFYYCSEDTWNLGSCLTGYMYSNEKAMCIAHMPQDICKPLTLGEGQQIATGSDLCQGKLDGSAVAHSVDCSRYYICINQSRSHEMQCPRGSYFQSSLGYCRPGDGSCRLPSTDICANASNESLMPHPSDCQAFYKCSLVNGTELLRCPEGQYFSNRTSQCRINQGECNQGLSAKQKCYGFKHGTRVAHETYCNIYYACIKNLTIPVECPSNYKFSNISGKCIPNKGQLCPYGRLAKEDSAVYDCGNLADGSYIPDLKDCTRYYICSEGQALPKKCANSSYFDNELLLCVPDDGFCPFVNDNDVQPSLVLPDPQVCEGKHGYLMTDPLNCHNFYVCIHNKLKHERCYSQHYFNSTSRQCQQQPKLETEITKKGSNMTSPKSQTLQCRDETTTFKKLCLEMSKDTALAEPGDCRRYVTCQDSDEEPVSLRCRNGESFDSLLGFCRQNDGTCLLENGERVGECSGKHGQLARDPSNCRNYFICVNGQKIPKNCGESEHFSKTENMCLKDTEQVCQPTQIFEFQTTQLCAGLSESVLYPYIQDDCRSYFQCTRGSPKIHICADGLYFDPLTIKCVKNKTECVMPTQTMRRSPALSLTFAKLCSNKKLDHPYANVYNDCRSFYLCHINGDISHELCPLGTIFNNETLRCTAENRTNCMINEEAT